MSPYLASLRVNLAQVRAEGYNVELPVIEPKPFPRGKNMPNVTAAVAAYEASDRARGILTKIATEYHTTPGSILVRIGRRKTL